MLLAFLLLALVRVFLPLPFANEIIIFSIYTMGCNFLLGRVGFISFGQPAYLAVGAYATAFYLYYFGTQPLRRHPHGHRGGGRRVRRRRPFFRPVAQRLFRPGQSGAGGDHLLSDAKGSGGHHPRRQRPVVSDQHVVHARAGPRQAQTSSSSSPSWWPSRSGRSTNISTTRSSAPAAWRPRSTRTS